MSIITKMRKQTAIYWPPSLSKFDAYGQPLSDPPVEISCRWEDVQEEILDPQGTSVVSKAKVYVDRDVELGGVLMLGELSEITDPSNPKANEGAWEIIKFERMPTLKATEFLRTVYL
jgi:hypothetical protein